MSDRTPCCIPYCNRTTDELAVRGREWICGKHWPLVPKNLKRLHARKKREAKRAADKERANRHAAMVWRRIKKRLTDSEVGL